MVDVTLQDVEVATESVENVIVLRVWDKQIRLNICLTALQVAALVGALQVAA